MQLIHTEPEQKNATKYLINLNFRHDDMLGPLMPL